MKDGARVGMGEGWSEGWSEGGYVYRTDVSNKYDWRFIDFILTFTYLC